MPETAVPMSIVFRALSFRRSQTVRMFCPWFADASQVPFSEKVRATIGVVADGAGNVCAGCEVLTSYSRTEPSAPPTASKCPSGWKATVVSSVWVLAEAVSELLSGFLLTNVCEHLSGRFHRAQIVDNVALVEADGDKYIS